MIYGTHPAVCCRLPLAAFGSRMFTVLAVIVYGKSVLRRDVSCLPYILFTVYGSHMYTVHAVVMYGTRVSIYGICPVYRSPFTVVACIRYML